MSLSIRKIKEYKKSNRGTYRIVVEYFDEKGSIRKKEFENKKKTIAKADSENFIISLQKFKDLNITNHLGKEEFSYSIKSWYVNFKKDKLKRSAKDTFESTINNHLLDAFPNKMVAEISSIELQKFINDKKEVYSESTVKKIYSVLLQYFKYLSNNKIIEINPMESCEYKIYNNEVKKTEVKIFTDDEIEKIKNTINLKNNNDEYIYTDGHVFNLILNTGLREGEVLALQNKDIDVINKKLTVNKAVREVRKRNSKGDAEKGMINILTSPKSKKAIRTIPLNNEAIESIKILQRNSSQDDYLIHDSNGNFLSENTLRKRFKRILDKSNIHNKSVHTLRHTFATKLVTGVKDKNTGLTQNIPIEFVSRILGHSSVQTTERIYIHTTEEVNIDNFEKYNI